MSQASEKHFQEALRQLSADTDPQLGSPSPPNIAEVSQQMTLKDRFVKAICSGGFLVLLFSFNFGLLVEAVNISYFKETAWPSMLLLLLVGVPLTSLAIRVLIGPLFPGPRYLASVLRWMTIGMFVTAFSTAGILILCRLLLKLDLARLTEPLTALWFLHQTASLSTNSVLFWSVVLGVVTVVISMLLIKSHQLFVKNPWIEYPDSPLALRVLGWLVVFAAIFFVSLVNSRYRATWEHSQAPVLMTSESAKRAEVLSKSPYNFSNIERQDGELGSELHRLLAENRPTGQEDQDEDFEALIDLAQRALETDNPPSPRLQYFTALSIDEVLGRHHRTYQHRSELEKRAVPLQLELWRNIAATEGPETLWMNRNTGTLFALENLLENADLTKEELQRLHELLESLLLTERDRNTYLWIHTLRHWHAWGGFHKVTSPDYLLGLGEQTFHLFLRARLAQDLEELKRAVPEGSKDRLGSEEPEVLGEALKTLLWRSFSPLEQDRELYFDGDLAGIFGLPNRLENALLGTKLRLYKLEHGSYPKSLEQLDFSNELSRQIPDLVDYDPKGLLKRKETPFPASHAPDTLTLP